MVNFKNHLHSKKIVLKDRNEVEEEYEFIALGAKALPKLFKTMNKFVGLTKDSTPEETLEKLDEETIGDLSDLMIQMVIKSYPSIIPEEAELFVGIHFMELMPILFEVNMNKN